MALNSVLIMDRINFGSADIDRKGQEHTVSIIIRNRHWTLQKAENITVIVTASLL